MLRRIVLDNRESQWLRSHLQKRLQPHGGFLYEDFFWRWDVNVPGKNLFREHLQQASDSSMLVRLIIACVDDPEDRAAIEAGKPAHRISKSFDVRKNWKGKIIEFSEDKFIIDFQIDKPPENLQTFGSDS
jgi:hypothetical protein